MATRIISLIGILFTTLIIHANSADSIVSNRMITNKTAIENLAGYYMPRSVIKVVLNNKLHSEFEVDMSGQYVIKEIYLNEGENLIEFHDSRGIPIKTIIAIRDTKKPEITIRSSSNKDVYVGDYIECIYGSNEKLKEITAKIPDGRFLQLLPTDRERSSYIFRWRVPQDLEYNKDYKIPVIAIDHAGNISSIEPIEFKIKPRFEIKSPRRDMVTSVPFVVLQGTLDRSLGLYVNQQKMELRNDGSFYRNYELKPSLNKIEFIARHNTADVTVKVFNIFYEGEYDDVSIINNKDDIVNLSALCYLDIISKSPERKFLPEKPIRRDVLATWLIRALNIDIEQPIEPFANDVDVRSWRAPYIKEIINLGIMQLDENGNFNPDGYIQYDDGIIIFDNFQKVINRASISYNFKKIKNIVFSMLCSPLHAEEERILTRIEAVRMLSAIDSINKKIRKYVKSGGVRSLRGSITPKIQSINVFPKIITKRKSPIYRITARIYDPKGITNIKKVEADLKQLGHKKNQILVDNGKWGDNRLNDSIYTYQGYVSNKVSKGTKQITIEVLNYDGIKLVTTLNMTIK